jgi:hypothetical protein
MKKTIATLIAGLFATAAFAQAPTAKQAVLVNNADLKAPKAETTTAHADAKVAKTHAKAAKSSARHAQHKAKHVAKTETMKEDAAAPATPAPPAAPAPEAAPAPAAPVTR